ncbi:hypothetical protein D3C85_664260 [compost metagenome]
MPEVEVMTTTPVVVVVEMVDLVVLVVLDGKVAVEICSPIILLEEEDLVFDLILLVRHFPDL